MLNFEINYEIKKKTDDNVCSKWMLENRFMSKITISPLFFYSLCIGTKGNYFQKKFIKLNIQLDIYYSYKCTNIPISEFR